MRLTFLAACCLLTFAPAARADAVPCRPAVEKGTVRFQPAGDQKAIPERYRLEAHTFDYEMELKRDLPLSGVAIYRVRFPSPVVTPTKENNTVHAEYYRPRGKEHIPCVIVLDITAGNQQLSRSISLHLAQNGIGALFVQMAYYGPRRPPGSKLRLLMPNYAHTMGAVRQTVLDLRRATAWMESRPEVDAKRLGILGTSLGSFMGSLTAEMEPKLRRVVVLLGGGGLIDAYYDDPRGARVRRMWELVGGTKAKMAVLVAPADPITCAANLKDRQLLIVAGKRDEIVPPKMARALWEASGRQKIVWYDCAHFTSALFFVPAMCEVVKHLGAE